ncbi:unnamed protein product [Prunus brigantina]
MGHQLYCGAVQSVAPVQQRSPSNNMADLSLNEGKGKDEVVADLLVGEDEEGILLRTADFTWPVSMQGYALQMFHSG